MVLEALIDATCHVAQVRGPGPGEGLVRASRQINEYLESVIILPDLYLVVSELAG
jgi:hypothetical protein